MMILIDKKRSNNEYFWKISETKYLKKKYDGIILNIQQMSSTTLEQFKFFNRQAMCQLFLLNVSEMIS